MRGRRGWVVPALLVALVGGVLWVQRTAVADQWGRTFGPQVSATLEAEPLPPGPLQRRRDASAVWTGDRLIVWGGYTSAGNFTYRNHADGAAYDPATRRWTTISRSPLRGREEHLAVWTGSRMLIWGGWRRDPDIRSLADGAAYDPATDRWTAIAPAPMTVGAHPQGVVWNGRLAVVPQQVVDDEGVRPASSVLLYDPAADRWQQVPAAAGPVAAAVHQGSLYVLGVPPPDDARPGSGPWLRRFGQDGEIAEVALPPLPAAPTSAGLVSTGAGLAVVAGGDRTTLARWSGGPVDLPQPGQWEVRSLSSGDLSGPVDLFAGFPGVTTALDDRRVATFGSFGRHVLDVRTGAVTTLPQDEDFCGSGAAWAAAGTTVYGWGGENCRATGPGTRTTATGVAYTLTLSP